MGYTLLYIALLCTFLSSHDQAIYGRTFKGSMVVRREVLWSYEQRVLGRTTKEPLNERERE